MKSLSNEVISNEKITLTENEKYKNGKLLMLIVQINLMTIPYIVQRIVRIK